MAPPVATTPPSSSSPSLHSLICPSCPYYRPSCASTPLQSSPPPTLPHLPSLLTSSLLLHSPSSTQQIIISAGSAAPQLQPPHPAQHSNLHLFLFSMLLLSN
ncbi:hypothetical protein LSTR_LSTR014924 [Laodelphax striatellus]|uniref:Uncharacterized protein n=1 Tax=Laodelphax striatellus TaxID=195883 RepID=A0A482X195_LAOST|nr:hypothetical protein LSTR_LSTR014924 [Laodelphax striatellus]